MKKILLIEDDVFLGDVLIQKLTTEGFDAVLARDGKEGFDLISTFKPELILLDIILPNMNGYEILEAKKLDPSISEIPVIIISNSGQPVEINRALSLGVKDYLVKAQFEPEEVMVKVRSQIRKQENNDQSTEPTTGNFKSLEGKKIMWVEDDKFLNEIVNRKLSSTKCIFFHATDGEKALATIKENLPDIIVLDLILPDMDGFEILSKIKVDAAIKHIPVIILSNLAEESNRQKSNSLGAARFIEKASSSLDDIIEQIQEVVFENIKHS
ncbi:MAG: response regulator transcription factor [bacterium]|nr:response regulator transcription factor [bacterium]